MKKNKPSEKMKNSDDAYIQGDVKKLILNMKKTFKSKKLAKKLLISSGVYDKNLKLTTKYKSVD